MFVTVSIITKTQQYLIPRVLVYVYDV